MIIGGVILTIALFVGIFIFLIPSLQQGSSNEPTSKIALTVWGVEDSSNFSQLATQYTAAHPNVALRYTQIPEDRYERTILNAFATGQAPDILMIHRSWVQRYSDKIMAADYPQIQPSEVRSLFPDVVYRDFVYLDYVFALSHLFPDYEEGGWCWQAGKQVNAVFCKCCFAVPSPTNKKLVWL